MAMAPVADLFIALRFFSRLPVPTTRREIELGASGLADAVPLVPLAGAIIGLVPALVLAASRAAGLPSIVAALLAVASLVLVTGALHEDALADCADGFGGGATRERKLAIMRDSRIGAYGACALVLSIALRATALAAAIDSSAGRAALMVIAAAAVSRTLSLLPLALLPPARTDGVGAAVPAGWQSVGLALLVAIIGSAVVLTFVASPIRIVAADLLAVGTVLALCRLAFSQIGGHTGDVAGAAQQLAEVAIYLVFAAT